MLVECHGHIFMDGLNYQCAVNMHRGQVCEKFIRRYLEEYQSRGIVYFRDGGDFLGVSKWAAQIAEDYGIIYRTPIFAIHKRGQYGSIVGHDFGNMKEYHKLVMEVRKQGGHFVKIIVSGIVDFSRYSVVTGVPLEQKEVQEMIHIAHEEGFPVMVHANGETAVKNALLGDADSIEHGYFMSEDCLDLMAERDVVWVPTLVPVRNLMGRGRYPEEHLKRILKGQEENVLKAYKKGVHLAPGSDAGAYGVMHGKGIVEEYQAICCIADMDADIQPFLQSGAQKIMDLF